MKNLFILIFFGLNIFTTFSQIIWKQDSITQKVNYKFAQDYLAKNDTINGIRNLYFTYKYGENTELGIKVKRELDSLIEIKQNDLLKRIKGKWILNKKGTNWGTSSVSEKTETILNISPDSIDFYKKEETSKILVKWKSEKISFTEPCYNCEESMFYLRFSDNQIWILKPNENNSLLQTKNDGYFNEKNERVKISCGNNQMYYVRQKPMHNKSYN